MTSTSESVSSPIAVLLGGGVESTALVKRFLAEGRAIIPIHVHCGLIWDDCESQFIDRFLAVNAGVNLHPLREIRLPLGGFLQDHWAVTGRNIPRDGAPAARLEIPLRNLTLLGFAVHRLRDVTPVGLAMGTTADNSYRDGNRDYFDRCQELLTLEAGRPVRILTPLIDIDKIEVIRRSDSKTLALSFSCVDPQAGRHCGVCIKCGRRRAAFRAAGVADPTEYEKPEGRP